MPVHHVPGGGHGSVFALTAELDKWLLSEKPQESDSSIHVVAKPQPENGSGATRPLADSPVEPPAASSRGSSPFWRLAPYVLLTIMLVVAVTYFTNLRTVNAYTSSLLHPLLSMMKPGSPSAVSDPEKQLAHEFYLRGRFEWNRRTADSLNRALDYFTQAVVHDPGNAQAYVGLADTYNLLREYTLMPQNEAYARAIAASKKAIALDDSLAEAHRSLAFGEVWGNWDFEAGEREFQRAIELNPRDPVTHLWFANAFAAPGWFPICLREIDRAQELDPASHAILADKGLMLFHSGKTKEGLELVRQVELTDPDFLSPHRYLVEMYLALHDDPGFLAESEKAAEISHDQVLKDTIAAARRGFQQDGERGLFHSLYLAQRKAYAEGKLPATYLAITCTRLGKKKEAIQLLQEDYEKHNATFLMYRQHLVLLTLKDEPGYQELARKIKIPTPEIVADAPPPKRS
jgi:Tfp pilus assembly protein PilF